MQKGTGRRYFLKKDISFGKFIIDSNMEIPFIEIETGVFRRGETFLPSVINVNDTNYFEETFVSRFTKDEKVIYDGSLCQILKLEKKVQKIYANIKNLADSTIKTVEQIYLKKTIQYYFINSDGTVCSNYFGLHPKKDTWLIGSGNCFINKEDALMEADILKAERIDNYNNFINEHKLQ